MDKAARDAYRAQAAGQHVVSSSTLIIYFSDPLTTHLTHLSFLNRPLLFSTTPSIVVSTK